jgi:hypothetical protein
MNKKKIKEKKKNYLISKCLIIKNKIKKLKK